MASFSQIGQGVRVGSIGTAVPGVEMKLISPEPGDWSEATGNITAGADEFRLTNATHQPDLSAVPDQSINPFDPKVQTICAVVNG